MHLEVVVVLGLVGDVHDGIVAVDREGAVVLWNEAAAKITGVSAADALGRTPADVLQRPLESSSEEPVPIMRGRETVWLSVTEAVMRDPAGAVYRTKEEVEREKLRDPIFLFRDRAVKSGALSDDDVQKLEKDVNDLVDEAVAFAEASPEPPASELFTDIFTERA